jgi:hypothetical protein
MLILAMLTGCNLPGEEPDSDRSPGALVTQAAQTVEAKLTSEAPEITLEPSQPPSPAAPTATLSPTTPPTVPPTITPTSSPIPTPTEALVLLFSDDFSTTAGWAEQEGDDFGFGFFEGGYRIYVNLKNANIWSIREKEYSDTVLEVQASRMSGPENGYYGLVCRHVDGDNYYALVIGSDGFYGIGKMDNGEFEFLKEGKDTSGVIQGNNAVNKLRADCRGETLRLSVNDKPLIEVQDDDIPSGSVGLMAGTRGQEGLQAWFDNFAIYQP